MCKESGKLIYQFGLTPEQVIGKELAEFMPLETEPCDKVKISTG